jgi:hypothetical protein
MYDEVARNFTFQENELQERLKHLQYSTPLPFAGVTFLKVPLK